MAAAHSAPPASSVSVMSGRSFSRAMPRRKKACGAAVATRVCAHDVGCTGAGRGWATWHGAAWFLAQPARRVGFAIPPPAWRSHCTCLHGADVGRPHAQRRHLRSAMTERRTVSAHSLHRGSHLHATPPQMGRVRRWAKTSPAWQLLLLASIGPQLPRNCSAATFPLQAAQRTLITVHSCFSSSCASSAVMMMRGSTPLMSLRNGWKGKRLNK